ncbi:MAG: DUF4905 domain-containing protein [Ignavibacteria bacterium]|nr:DUF4905 domain-containing protein [Ignavibacteria bacterium]
MTKIQKLFSFNQGRNIWRIVLTDLNQIVIEERDIQKKEVFFSCIDRISGKLFWKDKTFLEEKFWIGIEGTRSKYLILHQFEKPDMPNHKKIINVDLLTGELLWLNENLTFYDMDENFIYGFSQSFESREYYKLAIENGEVLSNLGDENQSRPFLDSIRERDYSKYQFTNLIGQSDGNQKELISKVTGSNPFLNFCEYIESDELLIFNFYDKISPQSLINKLVVYDKVEGKPILIETLNASTPAPVPDSFFIYDNELYFIKDKIELVAYQINL